MRQTVVALLLDAMAAFAYLLTPVAWETAAGIPFFLFYVQLVSAAVCKKAASSDLEGLGSRLLYSNHHVPDW